MNALIPTYIYKTNVAFYTIIIKARTVPELFNFKKHCNQISNCLDKKDFNLISP